uniref:Arp2/3 complex 34 kDa subunit n=3 Tax=Kalanchoe fedtschenkoi TaxID=63787 RepID=A0A7N0V830_KALFE
MGYGFARESPALKEILLRIRPGRPAEVDHHIYESGSVEYRVQSCASDPHHVYLSLKMPEAGGGSWAYALLSEYVDEMAKKYRSRVCEIVEQPAESCELTVRIDLAKIPQKREMQVIAKIAGVPALVVSSQLRQHLSFSHQNESQRGICKPVKLTYHPCQSFFVIRQPCKIILVYPMRFKEDSDVIIATAFFQELVDEGSSDKWSKAPQGSWSPIPPPELRGELLEDLKTNGGFLTFDAHPRHLERKKLDNITWAFLKFYAFLKYHIKSTKCFIQRRMKRRMESLLEVLHQTEEQVDENVEELQGSKTVRNLRKFYKSTGLTRRRIFSIKIRRIHFPVRIHVLSCFRWRCVGIQKEVQVKRYIRLH